MGFWSRIFGKSDPQPQQPTYEKQKGTDNEKINKNIAKIGTRYWMTENLSVDKYRNGEPIPEVRNQAEWRQLETGAWCYYQNDPENGKKYGKLYNWHAVNDPRGLAPKDWHIPTEDELIELKNAVSGSDLKALGEGKGSGAGTNKSGFCALLAGKRDKDGGFDFLGSLTLFWSSTEDSLKSAAKALDVNNTVNLLGYPISSNKGSANSVRCIKGDPQPQRPSEPETVAEGEKTNESANSVRCIKGDPQPQRSSETEIVAEAEKAPSNIVKIGAQYWMTENLTIETYRNGDLIPEAKSASDWENYGKQSIGCWCNYGNNIENGMKFGKLYNGFAVNDPRGLAPAGWHIPSEEEWLLLVNNVGTKNALYVDSQLKSTSGWRGNDYCKRLPDPYDVYKYHDYENGKNISGFNGLPSGNCNFYGQFKDIGCSATWWSSTDAKSFSLPMLELDFLVLKGQALKLKLSDGGLNHGFSVRCVRD